MTRPRGIKVEHPLGFAIAMNGNKREGYSKGGYALNKNGTPIDRHHRNPLKTR